MFSMTIAAAATFIAINAIPVTRPTDAARAAVVTVNPTDVHLESARRALALGAFDDARKEFAASAALDREAGRLPTESSFGLVQALFAQSYDREAAMVLTKLADDAQRVGDAEVEAKALNDLVWLNVNGGQRIEARANGLRLRRLLEKANISDETRRVIKRRHG